VFEQCLYFNTTALARLVEREWTAAFKEFDLTPPQGFMLRLLLQRPGILQHELADELTISRPTATRLLDGLERRGLVERRASPDDARRTELHPTGAARDLEPKLNQSSAEVTKRLKRLIGKDNFERTVAQLSEIRSALK
jgi:DNA-binding MarR family transcriptional regulator